MTTPPTKPRRLLWIVPEQRGGIATYARGLWPVIAAACHSAGDFEPLLPLEGSDTAILEQLETSAAMRPDIIHVQHEYGLFGGRNPAVDRFPRWIRRLRRSLPAGGRIVATAHTVVPSGQRLETRGHGWRNPFHAVANAIALPWLHRRWSTTTWGAFDGVVTHSRLQQPDLRVGAGTATATIPHVVPTVAPQASMAAENSGSIVTVFGYFCPQKGQDLAIEALRHCRAPVMLRLAGGPRLVQYDVYMARCRQRITELGLADRVVITGFVPEEELTGVFLTSDLVLAPFRWTSGSGSLAWALAHGAAVLASDLPLNREIADRVPGAVAFFRSEDPVDCGREIERLLDDAPRRALLAAAARQYAAVCSPQTTARLHLDFYRRIAAP